MELYILKPKFDPYINRVETIYPEDMGWGEKISYNQEEDFTEGIKKLQFRLALDHNDKKIGTIKYKGTDFYNGPDFLESSKEGARHCLDFYTVSPKMKETLEQLNLPKHRFYPIMLTIDKGKELPYFILQIDYNMTPYMDYSKSIYFGENIKTDEITTYKIGEIKEENQLFKFLKDRIFLREKTLYINQELDWVYMAPYFMISEKSKKLFEEHNLIDLEMTPFYEMGAGMYNELGYRKKYGGREIIINGRSTMDGLDSNDFEKKTE
ncbi:hypothetical protein BWK58_14215 [Flavobacterium columnare]|nr:hypothetical protein BWK58_14215 [Flavobacterium columnare]